MLAACDAAGVDEFADELPDGYDTLIGERGVNLSGGQRQRVALARALIAGARVLVLDDPLSAVDTETERLLVDNLRPAVAGRTVLVATQRLSTVQVADRAIVLVDGRIVEDGTPAELLRARAATSSDCSETSSLPPKRTGLSRLGQYLHGQYRRVAFLSVIALLGAAGPVIGLLLVQDAIDNGMKKGDTGRLTRDVIIYLSVNAAAWVLTSAMIRGLARVGQTVVLALREHLFEHLTALSLRYFSEQRAGWIIARLTSDVDAVSDVLSQGLTTLVVNSLTLVCAVIGLFILDWRLGLVALVILPPTLVLTRWFQVRSHAAFLEVRNTISGMTAQIAESVSGMAVIQAFNRERAFLSGVRRGEHGQPAHEPVRAVPQLALLPGDRVLRRSSRSPSVLLVGGRLHDQGSLSVGTLISAVFLLNLVFQPLQELSDLYGQVQSAGAAMEKISSVLDTEAEIRDKPNARARSDSIDGKLDLDEIWFAYGAEPVIRGVDLHIPAGACIALVGHTGHGKSTLAKLIGRFYDPDHGAIRVDDVDLRDVELRSYRRRLGVVLQDPFLFAGHDRGQHPLRAARRDRRAGARDRGVDRHRQASPRASTTGSTTSCARAARASPPASGS